ncbi:MAG: ketol-acid reductoisomerase [Candidatus Zixiibacteriota bacterium]
MRVIRSASLQPLKNRRIAVLGYGSQGRAQALNLRDAGFELLIGLPVRSGSRTKARRDRMRVVSPAEAVQQSNIIFVLAPDHRHGIVFHAEIEPNLRPGQMLVFAHASSVHFGIVAPPPYVDTILIAPLGPGQRLRELAGRSDGVACFFAIHQDPSRTSRRTGLALARAVGCIPAGAIVTTFADEAIGDLFGEQAVLCGGLGELLQAGVETLIRHGLSPENAYLECVYQLDLIVDLIKQHGLPGMYERISPTAAYGARVAGPRVIPEASRKAMDALYKSIASGEFFRAWVRTGSGKRAKRTMYPTVSMKFRNAESRVLKVLTPKAKSSPA